LGIITGNRICIRSTERLAGSVPVTERSGDAGGDAWQQPEPMSFSGEKRRKSEGFGRQRRPGNLEKQPLE